MISLMEVFNKMSEEKVISKTLGLKMLRVGGSKGVLLEPCGHCGHKRYNKCGCICYNKHGFIKVKGRKR